MLRAGTVLRKLASMQRSFLACSRVAFRGKLEEPAGSKSHRFVALLVFPGVTNLASPFVCMMFLLAVRGCHCE